MHLIDPEVVKFALGHKAPPIDKYNKSARKIANYTAARIALSCVSYPNPPFNFTRTRATTKDCPYIHKLRVCSKLLYIQNDRNF